MVDLGVAHLTNKTMMAMVLVIKVKELWVLGLGLILQMEMVVEVVIITAILTGRAAVVVVMPQRVLMAEVHNLVLLNGVGVVGLLDWQV